MAATLLRIKTKLMLPALPNEEEDPRAQLVEMLVEYQKYQKSADTLRHREIEYSNFFPRSDFSYLDIPDRIVEAKRPSVFDLVATFKKLLDNMPVETIHEVQLPVVTVEERKQYVLEFLKGKPEVRLEEMFGEIETRIYAVVTFLAVLELVRAGNLGFSQKYLFGPVSVWLKPTG
jgi:segregation and condensation protein A